MRLRGIHQITSRWSRASRMRAINDLAENARRQYFTCEEYREILNRITLLGAASAASLEKDRAYIVKGARYAKEDVELIPAKNVDYHRMLLHY